MGWSQGLERGGRGGGLVQRLFSCARRRDSLGQHTGQRPQKGQTSFPQRRGSGPGRPTQDLSDAIVALNRPSLSHRKGAAGPDPRHDHPLYRTRLQQGEADGARSGRGSMQAQMDLLS